jgi:hypothetical protein
LKLLISVVFFCGIKKLKHDNFLDKLNYLMLLKGQYLHELGVMFIVAQWDGKFDKTLN